MKGLKIELAPDAPVVFALDRSMSMSVRDCPEGMSRWQYALQAVRDAMDELRSHRRRVSLLTFGRDVHAIVDAQPQLLDSLPMGDAACCTGQAAAEALCYATHGGVVIVVSDGMPDGDTNVGRHLLSQPDLMRALFARTWFLTVGQVGPELQRFAERWPNHGRLEDAVAAAADTLPPPAAPEPAPPAPLSEHRATKPGRKPRR